MDEPIPVKVTRYACPHCYYSRARKRATVEHIARCWRNPDVKGCKTCAFFGLDWEVGDVCEAGVDLSGRPPCQQCNGHGFGGALGQVCPECDNSPEAVGVKPGPIVGCDKWVAR